MNKFLAVFILALVIMQALLLPATVRADEANEVWSLSCPNTLAFTTLPATDLSFTSAVLNGSLSEVVHTVRTQATPATQSTQEYENDWVFEYGTTPGIYPYRVNAEQVSQNINQSDDGNNRVISVIIAFKGTVSNLTPCTTYYARFGYIGYIDPRFIEIFCFEIINPSEISFATLGCPTFIGTGSHGAGGFNGTTTAQPTNLSNIVVQSATITSTKVPPGEKVDVTANVMNKGNSNGTSKIILYVNGKVAESKGITLTSGESTQVHFSVSQNDPGTYSVYVNGVPAGNLTVDLLTNNEAFIYGVIALFTIGIFGILYLVVRRRTA